jgi:hypothetical protein
MPPKQVNQNKKATIDFLKDVFSYAEDDMVLDPLLEKHLAHFGINVNQMEKVSLLFFGLTFDRPKKQLQNWKLTRIRIMIGAEFKKRTKS